MKDDNNAKVYKFYPMPDLLEEEIISSISNGKTLEDIGREIIRKHPRDNTYETLSLSYKSLYSLFYLLIKKKIWLSDISKFNDMTETNILSSLKAFNKISPDQNIPKEKINKSTFNDSGKEFKTLTLNTSEYLSDWGGISFTSSLSSPMMWGTCYGNDHNSICIEYKADQEVINSYDAQSHYIIPFSAKEEFIYNFMGKVVYQTPKEAGNLSDLMIETAESCMEELQRSPIINRIFNNSPFLYFLIRWLFTKHIDWAYEHEFRVIVNKKPNHILLSSLKCRSHNDPLFDIEKIILGQKVDPNIKTLFLQSFPRDILFETTVGIACQKSFVTPYQY
tara:strand:+ start:110 stop:1114 length:1005 start_codon:yes stop_codon:yes gene_type:complete